MEPPGDGGGLHLRDPCSGDAGVLRSPGRARGAGRPRRKAGRDPDSRSHIQGAPAPASGQLAALPGSTSPRRSRHTMGTLGKNGGAGRALGRHPKRAELPPQSLPPRLQATDDRRAGEVPSRPTNVEALNRGERGAGCYFSRARTFLASSFSGKLAGELTARVRACLAPSLSPIFSAATPRWY